MSEARVLARLMAGEELDVGAAYVWMRDVMEGALPEAEIAACLAVLRFRGETAAELDGFAKLLLERARKVRFRGDLLVDPVGTGGDGLHTHNISTMTALTLAAMGVPVAKHGNRASSSRSGSSDALEAAGVPLIDNIEVLESALERVGLAFLFAPNHHPALAAVGPLRRQLGIMTTFNLLGPLVNPAPVTHQLLGVSRPDVMRTYAQTAARRGIEALVVHGDHGADEALPTGPFLSARVFGDEIVEEKIDPLSLGCPRYSLDELRGGDAEENAAVLWAVLKGEGPAPVRDTVALNAGLTLALCGAAHDAAAGFEAARETLSTPRAAELLREYIAEVQP